MPELDAQDSGLNGIQSAVVPFHIVIVLLGLAVIAKHPDFASDITVVGRDGARFAAGSQVLARIEAEGRGAAHRSGLHPAILPLGKILRAVGLAGIFHHSQAEALGKVQDGIHIRRLARKGGRGRRPSPACQVSC